MCLVKNDCIVGKKIVKKKRNPEMKSKSFE